jgi:hypothetical protein
LQDIPFPHPVTHGYASSARARHAWFCSLPLARATARDLLGEPGFREQAARLARIIHSDASADRAVAELEAIGQYQAAERSIHR